MKGVDHFMLTTHNNSSAQLLYNLSTQSARLCQSQSEEG